MVDLVWFKNVFGDGVGMMFGVIDVRGGGELWELSDFWLGLIFWFLCVGYMVRIFLGCILLCCVLKNER